MNDKGYRTFLIIWFGQLVSRLGTAVTRFALIIWAYEQTDSVIAVALLGFCAFIPMIAVSPFAGVWIDRLERRKIMLLADLGAGGITLFLLILFSTGQLQFWHLYILEALSGLFEAFQSPAYIALTSQLLPKEQYSRASGLRSIANEGGGLIAPFLSGFLLVKSGLAGVMVLDLFTLGLAVISLLLVKGAIATHSAQPKKSPDYIKEKNLPGSHFKRELRVGFRYIRQRPGLFGLMIIYSGLNFIDSLTWLSILPVMILARSGGDEMALASVQGSFGLAGIMGGLLVAVWGGPRRKIHGTLLAPAFSFILSGPIIAIGQTTQMWMLGAWTAMIFVPILSGSEKAIWQSKVETAVQGRVFSVHNMVRQSMIPMGMLLGGLLADSWFEPAMMPNGSLVPLFGHLVGTGPGAGMAVLFLLTAFIGCSISLSGYLIPAVRYIEDNLPDQDHLIQPNTAIQPAV